MNSPEKNERKSRGGRARALALSPERRKEIAQEAANRRWANRHVTPERSTKATGSDVRMLKGIRNFKKLSVITSSSTTDVPVTAQILENGTVLQVFNGSSCVVGGSVQGYLAALQSLGVRLELTYEYQTTSTAIAEPRGSHSKGALKRPCSGYSPLL